MLRSLIAPPFCHLDKNYGGTHPPFPRSLAWRRKRPADGPMDGGFNVLLFIVGPSSNGGWMEWVGHEGLAMHHYGN